MKANKKKPTIIIADDLQFSREVIKNNLSKMGFENIRTAESGQQVMQLLSEEYADVVVADFWMPGMNGLELTRLIRRWNEYTDRYTGIVLLTGEEIDTSIKVAFEQGVDEFVTKSAHLPELAARIQGAARIARLQNQLLNQKRQLGNMLQKQQSPALVDEAMGLINKRQFIYFLDQSIVQNLAREGSLTVGLIKAELKGKPSNKTADNPASLRVTESGNATPNDVDLHDLSILPDQVFRAITTALKLDLRPLDFICRFDQNSFAICLSYPAKETLGAEFPNRLKHSILKQYPCIGLTHTELDLTIQLWHEALDQHHCGDQIMIDLAQQMKTDPAK